MQGRQHKERQGVREGGPVLLQVFMGQQLGGSQRQGEASDRGSQEAELLLRLLKCVGMWRVVTLLLLSGCGSVDECVSS